MSAIKRELERLADIAIYGTTETMTREFNKVAFLADGGAVELLAYAVEMSRNMMPLCECGADYYAELKQRFPKYYEQTNGQGDNA